VAYAYAYVYAFVFFLYKIKKVIIELGEEHIVQIVTDNGSNYKNAFMLVSQKYQIV
jgi:hypothetical protein